MGKNFFCRIEKDASVSKCREAIIIIKLHDPGFLNNIYIRSHRHKYTMKFAVYELNRRQQTTRKYFSDLASRK